MGSPLLTAIFLIVAGTLFFRHKDWIHRLTGFMLISAGLNIVAGMPDFLKDLVDIDRLVFIVWGLLIGVLCIVALFETQRDK